MPGKLSWELIGTGFTVEKFSGQFPVAPGTGLSSMGSRALDSAELFSSKYGDYLPGGCDKLPGDPSTEASIFPCRTKRIMRGPCAPSMPASACCARSPGLLVFALTENVNPARAR